MSTAVSRLMGVRVSVDVGGCPMDADFRGIFVEECRSESGEVGVGWGKDWGKRSKSNWWLPVRRVFPGQHPPGTTAP